MTHETKRIMCDIEATCFSQWYHEQTHELVVNGVDTL